MPSLWLRLGLPLQLSSIWLRLRLGLPLLKGCQAGEGKRGLGREGVVSLTGLLLPFVVWLLVLYLVSNSLDRKNGLVLTLIGVNISSDCPPGRPLLYRRRLRTTLVRLLLLL